jgi:hypothetical protein
MTYKHIPLLTTFNLFLAQQGISRDVWSTRFYILTEMSHVNKFMDRFPQPDHRDILTEFEVPDYGHHYMQRLQAYFLTPETGWYNFYMACSQHCFFYQDHLYKFSSSNANAASKYTG